MPDGSSFEEQLRRATAGTWLRVRPGGHCGDTPGDAVTLASIRDPAEVAEAIQDLLPQGRVPGLEADERDLRLLQRQGRQQNTAGVESRDVLVDEE